MPRPRTCPHCGTVIPKAEGFSFSDEGSLVCGTCKKVVIPAVRLDDYPKHSRVPGYPAYGVPVPGIAPDDD